MTLLTAMEQLGDYSHDLGKVIDIKGTDIYVTTVSGKVKIQVKCDFIGGEIEYGGSGYLYLQTAERNPFKRY